MANGTDKFDSMPHDRKADLLRRSTQSLRDAQQLLEHWQKIVNSCDSCQALQSETTPFLNGVKVLLKDIG